ncbi:MULTISPECIES: hypothetical protein [unclassified Streptomyces]|uniref:hypothetical protein n=1 Tax=unclassified Streptomyces TaxID=2593676 RepID=UPI00081DF581|nr:MULTISPECIES: hypothetical protein [unclassified Streptomyces]MYZ35470.1 hypothetical protein [Streptomyces sp. SID4917]SCF75739.1 hypothetical protein GA0115259_102123 [Streptomyces sp. MnatMP-M17]
MTITLPVIGAPSWGSPLNLAVSQIAHGGFVPTDQGLLAWNYDPAQCSSSAAPTSGQLRLIRLPGLVSNQLITAVRLHIAVAPVTPTAGQNFVGLYDGNGTRVAVSADCTTAFTTTGEKSIPLTSAYNASLGTYYVGILANAATPPSFSLCASMSAATANIGLTAATCRFGNGPAGQTTLPATVTMGSLVLSLNCTWVGVS